MNEEDINELSRLAEEIVDSGFENLEIGSIIEPYNNVLEEAITEAFVEEIRADAPETSVDTTVDTEAPESNEEDWHEIDGPDEPDTQEEDVRDFIVPNISNSTSEETTARFSSAEWFEKMKQQSVIIAGLGGIGSWTTLLLGRCHPKDIFLFDDDVIETVNMSGQLYGLHDIGRMKNEISVQLLSQYCNYNTVQQYSRYNENNHPTTNIMICGFDNMEARKYFYSRWKSHVLGSFNPENCLFIDGRLKNLKLIA